MMLEKEFKMTDWGRRDEGGGPTPRPRWSFGHCLLTTLENLVGKCSWSTVFLIFFYQISATDSMYHLLSPTDSCSLVVRLNDSLSLLCAHPPPPIPSSRSPPPNQRHPHAAAAEATSTSGEDIDSGDDARRNSDCRHFRSFVWRRMSAGGEATTITDSRRMSIRRGGGGGGGAGEEGSGRRFSILRIGSIQPEDASRYRCDIECIDSDGNQFTRHHTISVCIQQSYHQYAFCETSAGNNRCSRSFSDGICDSGCNSEYHLFDGFDCVKDTFGGGAEGPGREGMKGDCPADMESKCRRSYADGICDAECDIEPCARDGGDCIDRPLRLVDDILVMSVSEPFHRDPGHQSLLSRPLDPKTVSRSVSRLLRTVVRVLTDDWIASHHLKDINGHQRRGGTRERRQMTVSGSSSVRVYLKIDNTNCYDQCFDSSVTAAKFISLSLQKGWNPGFKVTSIAVLQRVFDRCSTSNDSFPTPPFDDSSADLLPPGDSDSSPTRLFGYSHWTTEDSRNALVWVVIAAVVGGMGVVLLVFAVVVFVSRINTMYQRRDRERGRATTRRPPRCPPSALPAVGDIDDGLDGEMVSMGPRTTTVVIGERYGTEV